MLTVVSTPPGCVSLRKRSAEIQHFVEAVVRNETVRPVGTISFVRDQVRSRSDFIGIVVGGDQSLDVTKLSAGRIQLQSDFIRRQCKGRQTINRGVRTAEGILVRIYPFMEMCIMNLLEQSGMHRVQPLTSIVGFLMRIYSGAGEWRWSS